MNQTDTPMTDAVRAEAGSTISLETYGAMFLHARTLERESAAKDATIARLRKAAEDLLVACDRVKYGASEHQVDFMDRRAEKLRAALTQ